MNLIITVHVSLAYLIGTIGLVLLVYWLIIISYRLYLIRNKHKQYLKASELDPRIHSQILYSFTTVRNRDICLVLLILLEILIIANFSFTVPELFLHFVDSNNEIKETLPNCTDTYLLFYDFYVYRVYALLFFTLYILVIIQLMLLSILNSYLDGRYFGHSFPKIIACKYIVCWIFQAFILTICVMSKLKYFFFPIITLLLFLNWLNLIASSRKVCRAIQSKMKEIRLFEWNPAQYRNHSLNLQQYRIAMGFLICAFFFLTLAVGLFSINYFFLVGNCFIITVHGINLNFNEIRQYTGIFNNWSVYILFLMYGVLLLFPSLFMFLYHMANLLYSRCTGKGNIQRINNALFEPLIN